MSDKLSELLPCPFCGNAELGINCDSRGKTHWITCRICETEGPADSSEEWAIGRWNRRASPAPAISESEDAVRRESQHWNPVYNTDPVQRACTALPDGYDIEIILELGAGSVDVCGPDGDRLDGEFVDDKFDWQIHAAIDAAIEDAARKGGKS